MSDKSEDGPNQERPRVTAEVLGPKNPDDGEPDFSYTNGVKRKADPHDGHDSPRMKRSTAYTITSFVYGTFMVLGVLLLALGVETRVGEIPIGWGWFLVLAVIFDAILGIRSVHERSFGALFFFGRPVTEVEPGPIWISATLFKLIELPRGVIQMEFPGEPEEVQKGDQDNIQVGKKATIRVQVATPETAIYGLDSEGKERTWSRLEEEEKAAIRLDPLNRRMTIEISGFVAIRIRRYCVFQFIQITGSLENAMRRIEDTWVSAAQNELGRVTLAYAIANKALISNKIRQAVEILVGEEEPHHSPIRAAWGVSVEDADLKLIDTGRTVNIAMADATASEYTKHATITKAEGDKRATELQGEGERSKITNIGEGEAAAADARYKVEIKAAKHFARIAETQGGRFHIAQQTVKEGLKESKHTIISPASEFLGAIAGVKEVWKSGDPAEPAPAETPTESSQTDQ